MMNQTNRALSLIVDIPAEIIDEANEYRESLIEAISDFDDDIVKYLDGEELTIRDQLGIRKATLSLKFVGVIPKVLSKIKAFKVDGCSG